MTQTVTDARPGPVQVDVVDADGSTTGTVTVPGEIFDAQANIPLMHQVVVAQLAAARQGTHKAKTRGEVAGGGKKPYRQKGTGRARQGSIRAPQFAGGGVVHGPLPRDHSKKVPKKMKAAALRGALSDRARDGRVHVVSELVESDVPSTKAALAALTSVVEARRVLVVIDREDELTWKSLRNVPTVHLLTPDQLNTYDVLVNDDVVFTTAALRAFLGGELEITEVEAKPKKKAAKKTEGKKTEAKVEKAKVEKTEAKAESKKADAKAEKADTKVEKAAGKAEKADVKAEKTEAKAEGKKAAAKSKQAELEPGPYGGSVIPPEDGSVPDGYPIKGNEQSGMFHEPGSRYYKATKAEFFFASVDDAEKAGFTAPGAKHDDDEEEAK